MSSTVFNKTDSGSIGSIIGSTYFKTLNSIIFSKLLSFCLIITLAFPSFLKVIKPLLLTSRTNVLLDAKESVL